MEPTPLFPGATLLDAVSAADAQLAVPAALVAGAAPAMALEAARAMRFVLFSINGAHYAVGETFVTELDRIPKITLVPQVPAWVRGVANIRGDVVSVIDLRTFLGLESTSPHNGRMLLVRLVDEEFSAGLLVDSIGQIVSIASEAIRPPASPLEGALAPFLAGVSVVGEQLVAVIDLNRLLRSPDVRQFEDVKEDTSCKAH